MRNPSLVGCIVGGWVRYLLILIAIRQCGKMALVSEDFVVVCCQFKEFWCWLGEGEDGRIHCWADEGSVSLMEVQQQPGEGNRDVALGCDMAAGSHGSLLGG